MPASARHSTTVRTPSRSYDVLTGAGLLDGLGGMVRNVLPKSGRAVLVADGRIPRALIDGAAKSLGAAGFECTTTLVGASEEQKSLDSLERVLVKLTQSRHEREDPVLAIGGGVVGDLAGFAASVYRRGVPVIQCPTTLLAMVDAAIGGKTAVNLRTGDKPGDLKKNMVGTFHQPHLVVCDIRALKSLDQIELVCGLAECVKHGLLGGSFGDPGLLDFIRASAKGILARDEQALVELVARNVAIKAACVSGDEREDSKADHGGRMALNMGHTVGHAIETIPSARSDGRGLEGLKHGQAVALGLIAEARCGEAAGVTPKGLAEEIRRLLGELGLPTKVAGLPEPATIRNLMQDDKKVAGGRLRLAVPAAGRTCRILTDPAPAAVEEGLRLISRAG